MDGDVGVGDVLLLAKAPLDVAQEVVGVRQVTRFLSGRTDGRRFGVFFITLPLISPQRQNP